MPKLHWREAPPIIRRMVEDQLTRGAFTAEDKDRTQYGNSPATAWINAATYAWSVGYDIDKPQTPAHDKIEALKAAKDWQGLHAFGVLQGGNNERDVELRALARWTAMRKWAAEPSEAELAAERRAEQERVAQAAALDARAEEIVAAAEAARLEKARATARKQAERELSLAGEEKS